MDTIEETRRKRLALLLQSRSQAALSKAIGKAPAQISQWVNQSIDSKTGKPRIMDSSSARHIEKTLNLPMGWMDQPVSSVDIRLAPEVITALECADQARLKGIEAALRMMLGLPPQKESA